VSLPFETARLVLEWNQTNSDYLAGVEKQRRGATSESNPAWCMPSTTVKMVSSGVSDTLLLLVLRPVPQQLLLQYFSTLVVASSLLLLLLFHPLEEK